MLRCIFLLALLALGSVRGQGAPALLTDIGAVRRLLPEEARQHIPVRLEATVTFHDPETGSLFVNDGTGDIFVRTTPGKAPTRALAPGERFQLGGTISPGGFLPQVELDSLRELGPGTLPPPRRIGGADLFDPSLDCAWVEIMAVVKGTTIDRFGALYFDLEVEGYSVQVHVSRGEKFKSPPWNLLERRVRVRCVVATLSNDERQMSARRLFLPRLEEMVAEEEAPSLTQAPLRLTTELLHAHSPPRELVKLEGMVTMVEPGRGLTLRDGAGSLLVRTAQPLELAEGDLVAAFGFAFTDAHRPQLRAVEVRRLRAGSGAVPQSFDSKPPYPSRLHQELVALEARLIDAMPSREGLTLLCAADSGERFEARLLGATVPRLLQPASRLHLTGICTLLPLDPRSRYSQTSRWEMQLRRPEDIRLVKAPPWLTPRRAAWLVGGLLAAASLAVLWVALLRRQVQNQSAVIRQQASREATLEERQRIARELHDTLEQDLMGVNMLLDLTAQQVEANGSGAGRHLGLARQLLRRSRAESHSTIRDLRSVALDQLGLPGAMEEGLQPIAAAAGVAFNLEVSGTRRRLPAVTEHHLLRVAHEGVSNTVKHAAASQITVQLDYTLSTVRLEIRDNGRGGAPDGPAENSPGFGLHSISERANKLGAALQIDSPLGEGTRLRLTVPVPES